MLNENARSISEKICPYAVSENHGECDAGKSEMKDGSRRLVFLLFVICIAVSLCLLASGCSSPTCISGVWTQETANGEKVLTISDLGDSYSLVRPDGIQVTGAIYQSDE